MVIPRLINKGDITVMFGRLTPDIPDPSTQSCSVALHTEISGHLSKVNPGQSPFLTYQLPPPDKFCFPRWIKATTILECFTQN